MRSLLALALAGVVATTAAAQNIDAAMRQVASDPDYKVRLSAALSLGRLRDKRALPALTTALSDDAASVRAVSAGAIAQIVDRTVAPQLREAAAGKLKIMSASDADAGARLAASRALEVFMQVERLARPRPLRDAVYVNIEPMKDEAGGLSEAGRTEVTQAARDALLVAHDTAVVEWAGGKLPSPADLAAAKVRGAVTLVPSLGKLEVAAQGRQASVACQVKVILASYPGKAMRAFFSGGAKVSGPNNVDAIEGTKVRCLKDLLGHLAKKELAPGIDAAVRE